MKKFNEEEKEIALFRPHKPGIRKILGDLEADIMETMWAAGSGATLTVRDVHHVLLSSRGAAYTTVMTVMGNLAKKGLLLVEKDSHAHQYRARQTKDEFTRAAVGTIIDQLLSDFSEPALAHFAASFEQQPPETLKRLEELIAIRRQQEG